MIREDTNSCYEPDMTWGAVVIAVVLLVMFIVCGSVPATSPRPYSVREAGREQGTENSKPAYTTVHHKSVPRQPSGHYIIRLYLSSLPQVFL